MTRPKGQGNKYSVYPSWLRGCVIVKCYWYLSWQSMTHKEMVNTKYEVIRAAKKVFTSVSSYFKFISTIFSYVVYTYWRASINILYDIWIIAREVSKARFSSVYKVIFHNNNITIQRHYKCNLSVTQTNAEWTFWIKLQYVG